jgi:hypothetical protein
MSIADIGRGHLRAALTGEMFHCDVDEWKGEDGKPCKIYWQPLTGVQQKQVDKLDTEVGRTLMMLKVRSLDEKGKELFIDTPMASLENEFDYGVIRTIVFLMLSGMGQDNHIEEIEKE